MPERLSEGLVVKIRNAAAAGKTTSQIAKEFRVAWDTAAKYARLGPVPITEIEVSQDVQKRLRGEAITEIEIPVDALVGGYLVVIEGASPRVERADTPADVAATVERVLGAGQTARVFSCREVHYETVVSVKITE